MLDQEMCRRRKTTVGSIRGGLRALASGGDALGLRIGIHVPVDTSVSGGRIDGSRMRRGRTGGGLLSRIAEQYLQGEQVFRWEGDGGQNRIPCLLRGVLDV